MRLIGKARPGKVAFVRDAPPDVIRRLACDLRFQQILKAQHWQVYGVADREDKYDNTITSDQAVALREKKGPALLLLVDRQKAGPGMDGVYSACLEIKEEKLFERAVMRLYRVSNQPPTENGCAVCSKRQASGSNIAHLGFGLTFWREARGPSCLGQVLMVAWAMARGWLSYPQQNRRAESTSVPRGVSPASC